MARLLGMNSSDPKGFDCQLPRPLVFAILLVVVAGLVFAYKTDTYADLSLILEQVLIK